MIDIYSEIKDLKDIEILRGNYQKLRSFFNRLDQIAAIEIKEELVDDFVLDKSLKPALEEISRLRRLYGLRLETEQASSVLESSDPWSVLKKFRFYANYLQLADMEFHGSGISRGDRVVFLGSGPLPLTIIILCKEYRLEAVGIEELPEYTVISKKIIEHLGLSQYIDIIQGNHFSLPIEKNFKLVMVASAAQPKNELFNHLSNTLPPETKVCYRIYEKGFRRLLDIKSKLSTPAQFKEIRRIQPEKPVNNTVVILKKI